MSDSSKCKLPWLAILLIILAGVIVSGVLLIVRLQSAKDATQAQDETRQVSFYNIDGTVLNETSVTYGTAVMAPSLPKSNLNYVFHGWDKTLGGITEDIQIYPVIEDLSEYANALYIDSYYVQNNSEFWVDIILAGNVSISQLDIGIDYDSSVLKYVACDDNYLSAEEDEEGFVIIRLDEEENITESRILARLCFRSHGPDFTYTELLIKNGTPKHFVNGNIAAYDCAAVNGRIYIYN